MKENILYGLYIQFRQLVGLLLAHAPQASYGIVDVRPDAHGGKCNKLSYFFDGPG